MKSPSKMAKKAIQQQYKQAVQQELLQAMPIDRLELEKFLDFLEKKLAKNGCDHSFKNTIDYFKNYPNTENILDWLVKSGGSCDCGVILNVPDTYYFILKNYLEKQFSSSKKSIAKPSFQSITAAEFISSFGLKIDVLAQPWKLYKILENNSIRYEFYYGKKKNSDEFKIIYQEEQLAIKPDEENFFVDQWVRLTNLQTNGLQIEKLNLKMSEMDLSAVIVSSKNFTPVYGWIFNSITPGWYMLIETSMTRKLNDVRQIQSFLNNFQLQ